MAISVEYSEMADFPRATWVEGEFVGTRRLICAWGDRDTLLMEIGRDPDWSWPYDDGPPEALARAASIMPYGKQGVSGELATYEKALITIKYSTKGPRYYGGTLISEELRPATWAHTLEPEDFRWTSGAGTPLKDGEAPSRIMQFADYVLKFHRVFIVPGWVLSRMGTCNSNVVTAVVLGLPFNAQTLLYQPPTIRTSVTTGRITTYDVTTHYKVHPVGWNTFWRQATAQYEAMYVAGGGQYIQYPPVAY